MSFPFFKIKNGFVDLTAHTWEVFVRHGESSLPPRRWDERVRCPTPEHVRTLVLRWDNVAELACINTL
jgi:hypothetical protein